MTWPDHTFVWSDIFNGAIVALFILPNRLNEVEYLNFLQTVIEVDLDNIPALVDSGNLLSPAWAKFAGNNGRCARNEIITFNVFDNCKI
jgi:hypothetical protein